MPQPGKGSIDGLSTVTPSPLSPLLSIASVNVFDFDANGNHRRRLVDDPENHAVQALIESLRTYFKRHYQPGEVSKFYNTITKMELDGDTVTISDLFQFISHHITPNVKRQEVAKIFLKLDVDGSGKISVDEFTGILQEPLNKSRSTLVKKAYKACFHRVKGLQHNDPIPKKDILRLYQVKHDPYVRGDPEERLERVCEKLCGIMGAASLDDFYFYYTEHTEEFSRDDDEFGILLSKLWNFSFIPSYSLDRVAKMMRQAIETGHGQGVSYDQVIKESFERYDKNHDGVLNLKEFKYLLNDINVSLTDGEEAALFDHFDKDGDKTISLEEFTHAISKSSQSSKKKHQ